MTFNDSDSVKKWFKEAQVMLFKVFCYTDFKWNLLHGLRSCLSQEWQLGSIQQKNTCKF